MRALTVEPGKKGSVQLEDIPEPDAGSGSVLVEAIEHAVEEVAAAVAVVAAVAPVAAPAVASQREQADQAGRADEKSEHAG